MSAGIQDTETPVSGMNNPTALGVDNTPGWSPQNKRYAIAGALVLAMAVSLWLFGRSGTSETPVDVVTTAESWPAGQDPQAFVTIPVPEDVAGFFVRPEELVGRVPRSALPAGVVVSPAMLGTAGASATASDSAATLLAVSVDASLWPPPGPAAGNIAVFAENPGACAMAILPLVEALESAVVVEVAPSLAEVLAPTSWWAWESPRDGWHLCVEAPHAAFVRSQAALSSNAEQAPSQNSSGSAKGSDSSIPPTADPTSPDQPPAGMTITGL